jgi:hypothetical protein
MNLNAELLLSITAACLGMMAGNVYSLFTNRGWNIHPTLSIALSILTVLIGGYIFRGELGTVKGVLKFNIYCNILNLSINSLYLLYKINLVHKIQHKSQE